MNSPFRALITSCLVAALCLFAGCDQNVQLQGVAKNVQGEHLPGVAVTVRGTNIQDVTDAHGTYELEVPPGLSELDYLKTGFTPARVQVEVVPVPGARRTGTIDVTDAVLWPLPLGRGAYFYDDYRYERLTRAEPEEYEAGEQRIVYATEEDPDAITYRPLPFIVCYKMPSYDVYLNRLHEIDARNPNIPDQEMTVWAAGERLPVLAVPIDEPERLLVEVRLQAPLTPGRYAVHWGALDGYMTTAPEIYLFEVRDPAQEAADAAEGEAVPEGEAPEGPEDDEPSLPIPDEVEG